MTQDMLESYRRKIIGRDQVLKKLDQKIEEVLESVSALEQKIPITVTAEINTDLSIVRIQYRDRHFVARFEIFSKEDTGEIRDYAIRVSFHKVIKSINEFNKTITREEHLEHDIYLDEYTNVSEDFELKKQIFGNFSDAFINILTQILAEKYF